MLRHSLRMSSRRILHASSSRRPLIRIRADQAIAGVSLLRPRCAQAAASGLESTVYRYSIGQTSL